MRLVVIAGQYPSASRPGPGTFVRQFVRAMAGQGHDCEVVSPVGLFDRRFGPYPPLMAAETVEGGTPVRVHRPRYVSFSSRNLGWAHTGRWTNAAFARAAMAAVKRLSPRPDLIYGHFLYPAGHAAIRAARALGVPSVVGVGEGEFWTVEAPGFPRAARDMAEASAFLAVSTCIAEGLTTRLAVPPEKIAVFPNGVDRNVFHPRDREAMCRKLGIPSATFNVGFAGPRIAQKGYPQLLEAVEGLEDVRLVLLGRGPHPAGHPQTAFCGTVPHAEIADYWGACDVFVLPTRIEGSCNAVIEAMACGLPIVTASGRYMDDIVNNDVAIRVDPADVGAIRAAILVLKNDPARREQMSRACLNQARTLDSHARAQRVTAWFETLVSQPSEGAPS
jgi:teichuronic acid biosynthesis glycosyltransferase TuaC